MTTRLLIWLTVGTLSACATERLELPAWDIPEASAQVTQPLALPDLPPIELDGDVATLDRAAVLALLQYQQAAEANHDIAADNGAALASQSAAYNELIEAGKLQQEIARIREEQLELARREAFVMRWFYRGTLVLLAAAAL